MADGKRARDAGHGGPAMQAIVDWQIPQFVRKAAFSRFLKPVAHRAEVKMLGCEHTVDSVQIGHQTDPLDCPATGQ